MIPRQPKSTLFPYTTLFRSHDEVHVTTVLVTHDQAEALDVADRIAVLNKGRIEQVGSPTDVYDEIGRAHVELQSRRDLVCRLLLEKKKRRVAQQDVLAS